MIKEISTIALTCLLLTTGCSEVQKRASDTLDNQSNIANKKLEKLKKSEKNAKDIGSVRHSDRVWLGSRGYRQQNGDPLPNKYDNITYMSATPQSLNEIVSDLSSMTGMRFIVKDAGSAGGGFSEASDAPMDLETSGSLIDGMVSSSNGNGFAISYSGDFVGLLNLLSTKFDISWEHKENIVYLSKHITRTLALYALPSTTELESTISSESDSSEGGEDGGGESQTQSGTDNTVELNTTLNVWEEIDAIIESMLPDGSTYALSPSTGTLTITSSPLAVRKVENLIKKQNEILSRQVVIDVNVMSIVLSETETFQVDLSSVLSNISDNFGLEWSGPTGNLTEISGLGSFTSSYVSDSGLNTADLLLDALSQRFKRSNVTNSTVTTLNNHTVPLQIITREAYLKTMEQSVDEGVITSSATPGDLTTGFVMNVLPRILANGNIVMQYSMSISEKTSLEKITFGASSGTDENGDPITSFIQLPTVVSRDFLQNVKLKSGNTLILAGYDRLINISEEVGTGVPNNFWLGGGKTGEVAKEVLVIMITPRIIE